LSRGIYRCSADNSLLAVEKDLSMVNSGWNIRLEVRRYVILKDMGTFQESFVAECIVRLSITFVIDHVYCSITQLTFISNKKPFSAMINIIKSLF
jgi:hypothetical protein